MSNVTKGMLRDRARGMRREPSQAERALWARLRSEQCGAKFRRQHPVEPYIADFASIDAKLIVEIDGPSHDDTAAYDAARTAHLAQAGWRVLRVRDDDVLTDIEAVIRKIKAALR